MRLVLLTEIPAPYRIPLFNALAEQTDLHVVFLRERNPERPYGLHRDEWRFRWTVLRGRDVTLGRRWLVLNTGVLRALRGADAVVVGGWNQPAFWQALALAKLRSLPVVVWVESTQRDARSGAFDAVKRMLVGAFDAVVVPGRASSDHVRSLGVREQRITVAANAVDIELFGSPQRRASTSYWTLFGRSTSSSSSPAQDHRSRLCAPPRRRASHSSAMSIATTCRRSTPTSTRSSSRRCPSRGAWL
jgi:hypothetical protein